MGEAQQYCLKWNNHPRNVATVFDRLRMEELFVDVTLATSDRQIIRAHRVLLSAGSAYLERVLAITPCEHPTIVLSNIRYKELKLLVDFMYSGEIAVDQAQFPGLMESANWLMVRGLCTEEEAMQDMDVEKEEEESPTPALTVTPSSGIRKRQYSEHSEEEEEEEEEEPIIGPEENGYSSNPAKQMKPMYNPIQGVNNAVWMMHPETKQEDLEKEKEEKEKRRSLDIPDLVTVTSQASSRPKAMLNPSSLNEQLLQAMQLCTNPYLNPMASNVGRDFMSPNSSFSGFSSLPFKSSSPTSPMKSCMLMSSAPVRRYKQYTEDSLQAALKEIMNGQSINRSSMKHNIPARTLRDWMKRLNIKSVFTHHSSNGKERSGSQGTEDESLASSSPEPLALTSSSPEPLALTSPEQQQALRSPTFGLSPTNLKNLIRNGYNGQEEEIDDDEEAGEEGGLRIDEGGPGSVGANMAQIAQAAN